MSYFAVAPDAHERAELLAATGHSGHGSFATFAVAATFAAAIGLFMHRIRTRRDRRMSRARVATGLWAIQTLGFALLETWERGHGLAGVVELVHEPAFLVGLVAQVLVALAATAIVLIIDATARALLRLFSTFVRATDTAELPRTETTRAADSLAHAAWNLRGPPSRAGYCN